ncbi:MAG: hypothetical protein AAFV69_13150, partial [Pseudomonadota bacterium]
MTAQVRAPREGEGAANISSVRCSAQQAISLCETYLAGLVCPSQAVSNGLGQSLNCPEPLSASMAHTLLGSSKRARAVLVML